MKKIIALILCLILVGAMPVIASAEDSPADAIEGSTAEMEETTAGEENASEGEKLPSGALAETEDEEPFTEQLVSYVKSHIEELSVIFTLLLTIFYDVQKHGKMNGSIGTLNNNAISVAKNSARSIEDALARMNDLATVVKEYADGFDALAAEVRQNAEDKQALESMLAEVKGCLGTSKLVGLELANEVAELLVLANIPNSKKEELYARHKHAVDEIKAAEEVKSHDGNEA